MTLPNMESSEMPQEIESSEVQESVESAEVQEEAAQLEQATFEPEAVVELEKSHQDAEVVEAAFTETMQAAERQVGSGIASKASEDDWEAPVAAEGGQGSRPGGGVEATPINLPNPQDEVSATPILLPDELPPVDRAAIIDTNDGPRTKEEPQVGVGSAALGGFKDGEMPQGDRDPAAIIDTNDSPRPAVDDGPRLGDDRVMIDTVPLPEDGLDGVAIIDTNDGPRDAVDYNPRLGDDRVKIDTVPLPEDDLDGVAIIDTNDNPRPAVDDGPRLGDDRVMIDTVPLPEDDLDGVAIIDTNDGPRTPLDDSLRDDLRMGEQGYLGEMDPIGEVGLPKTGVDDRVGGATDILDGAPGKVDDPFDGIPEWGETEDGQSLEDAAAAGADTRAGISTIRRITGKIWGAITKGTTDSGGGGGGVRGTPTPDSIEGTFEDPLGVMDIQEKTPTDHAKSMMQPVDDEGQGREEPGMKMSAEELRDAQLNPYIQNTDEHVDVLPGSRDDMTDPKDFLIDNDLEPFAPGAGGGTNPLAKPSTNDDAPPPPPPGGGKPGTSMEQMGDMVSSKPPDGGDGKPPDGADQVFKPSTNDDAPPPPPPGGGKPGTSMGQMEDMVSSKPPDGGDGKPPDGADLNMLNALDNSLSLDDAPADLSSMMDEGTMLNANENKNLKDMDVNNTQNLEATDGKL